MEQYRARSWAHSTRLGLRPTIRHPGTSQLACCENGFGCTPAEVSKLVIPHLGSRRQIQTATHQHVVRKEGANFCRCPRRCHAVDITDASIQRGCCVPLASYLPARFLHDVDTKHGATSYEPLCGGSRRTVYLLAGALHLKCCTHSSASVSAAAGCPNPALSRTDCCNTCNCSSLAGVARVCLFKSHARTSTFLEVTLQRQHARKPVPPGDSICQLLLDTILSHR